ncbi:MAG: nucleoside triphosphate pyrophosphatase [Planctomycetota bacterium]
MPDLILASSSPRRRELLQEAGYQFTIESPSEDAEPETIEGLSPTELVAELARLKAIDVAQRLAASGQGADSLVLAADTVAECDGRVLGKPKDENHAREMLSWLSGREHLVLTGICLMTPDNPQPLAGEVVVTQLVMSPLEEDWLEPFLATGGWRGKAGAFGFQDGLAFVRILNGSASNVVGLPMERVTQLLGELGCHPTAG